MGIAQALFCIYNYKKEVKGTWCPYMCRELRNYITVLAITYIYGNTEQAGTAVMLQTCILEVLVSNLGRNTAHRENFRCFPKSFERKTGLVP
jgi:hypothetical protein